MKALIALLGWAASAGAFAQAADNAALIELEKALDARMQKQDYGAIMKAADENRKQVVKLIEGDKLQTGKDFLRAAKVIDDPLGWYENRRLQHELTMIALLMGEQDAIKQFTRTWDSLLISMAQGQRFATMMVPDQVPGDRYYVNPVAPAIFAVFDNPAAARQKAKDAKDNSELQKLKDEDQAGRQNFASMIEADMMAMAEADRKRRIRVIEMLGAGALVTARDFYNAGLIMQHGDKPGDYMLAHELVASAGVIDPAAAAGLISRTYDRYLMSLGHRQRLATQWGRAGLMPQDWSGVNDRMLTLTKTPKRADIEKRSADIAAKAG